MTLMTWVAAAPAIHQVVVRQGYLYAFKVLIGVVTGLDYD